jgi:TIGR03009 family protein
MRIAWFSLAALFTLGNTLLAQQPPQPPRVDPATQQKLDMLLNRWEQEMKAVESLVAQCNRTTVNKTFQATETYSGTASFLKPNMAMLDMKKQNRPDVYEKFICTGNKLYEFSPQNRAVRVHELPPPKQGGAISDDNFLSFLFGMKAEEAKRRYDLRLEREDQYYYYVTILPRMPQDKADFQQARLVLVKQSFLPRELWFVSPNGDETKWDIPRIDNGARLNAGHFNPQLPPGWTMQRVPQAQEVPANNNNQLKPRVARPNGQ